MAKEKAAAKNSDIQVVISPLNTKTVKFKIRGTSPYVQEHFTKGAKAAMRDKMLKGDQPAKKEKRGPRDFDKNYEESMYYPEGETWPNGAIPATQIKAAMVGACRLIDFKMTDARQCIYVEADGYDDEGVPLIKFTKGKPKQFEQTLPNTNGGRDIRVRGKWAAGWEALVSITYDADRFTLQDVANLLMRAGVQSGIGAGRQASRKCVGLGWGAFTIEGTS